MYHGTVALGCDSEVGCSFSEKYDDAAEETEYVDVVWRRAAARDDDEDLKKGIFATVMVDWSSE